MHSGMDVTSVDKQPKQDNSAATGIIFFVMAIFVCAFFILNMVVGVIIEKFNQMSGRGMLTDDQKKFKDIVLNVMTQEVEAPKPTPEGGVRGSVYKVISHPNFETLVLFLILLNSAVMASEHYGQTKE